MLERCNDQSNMPRPRAFQDWIQFIFERQLQKSQLQTKWSKQGYQAPKEHARQQGPEIQKAKFK